ncbi:zyx-1 [Pristionchus pacificus]|uniref:Zyx-1 n=1 Tax=Pristionchus pacificus TaxID=54126 RepID=A0A2A6BZB1_PRIPA|nr:zyx-1 [Pristionchus pacificus]|eukprot:PDM71186.1 zyx-1 [Pristionchus pacificus]
MGINQTRTEIPSPSSNSDITRSIGNVRRPSYPLNTDSSPQRFVSTATFSSSDYSTPTRNNNSIPLYSSPFSSPFSSSFASSFYASPSIQSTSSSSSWVSQIDNTLREHTSSPLHVPSPASSLYAVPTRLSPQPVRITPSNNNNNDGLLYSAINKTSSISSSPPFPPPPSFNQSSTIRQDFARELRDQGLTERQRMANEQRKSGRRLEPIAINADSILQASRDGDEISRLVNEMSVAMGRSTPQGGGSLPLPSLPPSAPPSSHSSDRPVTTTTSTMNTITNRQTGGQSLKGHVCVNCNQEITNDKPGCTALNQIFHVSCFVCSKCGDQLAGSSFYNVDGKPICEKDYVDSLERCAKCSQPISDRLLRAVGGAFHVQCFTCVVCNIALDGIPFTVDPENRVHCVPCFHEAFAPRCSVCSKPIVPQDGEKESVRVVAMEKSFHVECYRCEDCGTQLSSKVEGQGCYPLDNHLYCKTCNGNRLRLAASS